jgi:hypothetical protein
MNLVQYGSPYTVAGEDPKAEAMLRFEVGWSEVRRGLGLILRGYFVLIAAVFLLIGLIWALFLQAAIARAKIPWQVRDISLFLGLTLLGVAALYSYGCIVVGHWRCLMNAPERRGARWLMFACLTCILAGPMLNFGAGLTGVQTKPKLERGFDGIRDLKYTRDGAMMQLGSGAVSALGNVLFILFLRAVARCFEDRARVFLVNIYLVFVIALSVATVGLTFAAADFRLLMIYLIPLGLGWLASFVGYLIVVALIRSGITHGLSKLSSPLKA